MLQSIISMSAHLCFYVFPQQKMIAVVVSHQGQGGDGGGNFSFDLLNSELISSPSKFVRGGGSDRDFSPLDGITPEDDGVTIVSHLPPIDQNELLVQLNNNPPQAGMQHHKQSDHCLNHSTTIVSQLTKQPQSLQTPNPKVSVNSIEGQASKDDVLKLVRDNESMQRQHKKTKQALDDAKKQTQAALKLLEEKENQSAAEKSVGASQLARNINKVCNGRHTHIGQYMLVVSAICLVCLLFMLVVCVAIMLVV